MTESARCGAASRGRFTIGSWWGAWEECGNGDASEIRQSLDATEDRIEGGHALRA